MSGQVRYWHWHCARQGEAHEISAGGIFVKTRVVLPEGAHVTLRLQLPGASRGMTVLGRVVRTALGGPLVAAGMGIRFLDLFPAQRLMIESFVTSRA